MVLEERSLTSQNGIRPKPIVKQSSDGKFMIIATVWGVYENIGVLISETLSEMSNISIDDRTKVVGAAAPNLDDFDRMQALLARMNSLIYSTSNTPAWKVMIEMTIICLKENVLNWVGVGQPQLLIKRGDQLMPIRMVPDWSVDSRSDCPLVTQGLGIDDKIFPAGGTIYIDKDSDIILLGCSKIPPELWSQKFSNINDLTQLWTRYSGQSSCWLGWMRTSQT